MVLVQYVLLHFICWVCVVNGVSEVWLLTGESMSGNKNGLIGEEYSLLCNTENGKISDHMYWRRNDIDVAHIKTKGCNFTIYQPSIFYQFMCISDDRFRLMIPSLYMNDAEHNTSWICWNSYGFSSNQFILDITVPVDRVSIFPKKELFIDVGQQFVLICTTNPCRPPADIIWYKGKYIVTSRTQSEVRKIESKYLTSSNLSMTAKREDNGVIISCAANNTINGFPASTKRVSISTYYPPQRPPYIRVYEKYKQNAMVFENSNMELTCKSDGGNPAANLSWNCIGQNGNYSKGNDGAISVISVIAQKWMDGKICSCRASHRVHQYEREVRITIKINPTLNLEIGNHNQTIYVEENDHVTFKCDSSFTEFKISFKRAFDRWSENDVITYDPKHSKIVSLFDSGRYACSNEKDEENSRVLLLYVQGKPKILENNNDTVFLKEGETLNISVSYVSLPNADVTWSRLKNGTLEFLKDGKDFTITESVDKLEHVSSIVKEKTNANDFGNYSITLKNVYGVEADAYSVIISGKSNQPRHKREQTGKIIVISIPICIFIVAVTIVAFWLVRKYSRKAPGSIGQDVAEENFEESENMDTSKSSTSNISHIEAYLYESSDENVRDYQNAGRVIELEAWSSYEDLTPEDPVQILTEWPYEDVPEIQEVSTELVMLERLPTSNDYENQPIQPDCRAVCDSESSDCKSGSAHSYEND